MILLGKPKISGGVAVTSNEKGTLLVPIPDNAAMPAHLCIRNGDNTATIYFRTVPKKQGGKVSSTVAGGFLLPGESYDWGGCPPRGVDVIATSTVDGTIVNVEGNWALSEDE